MLKILFLGIFSLSLILHELTYTFGQSGSHHLFLLDGFSAYSLVLIKEFCTESNDPATWLEAGTLETRHGYYKTLLGRTEPCSKNPGPEALY